MNTPASVALGAHFSGVVLRRGDLDAIVDVLRGAGLRVVLDDDDDLEFDSVQAFRDICGDRPDLLCIRAFREEDDAPAIGFRVHLGEAWVEWTGEPDVAPLADRVLAMLQAAERPVAALTTGERGAKTLFFLGFVTFLVGTVLSRLRPDVWAEVMIPLLGLLSVLALQSLRDGQRVGVTLRPAHEEDVLERHGDLVWVVAILSVLAVFAALFLHTLLG